MKGDFSYLRHWRNERGFIFPYVYFLSLLFISILLMNISSLKTEMELVELKEEQLKLELLYISEYQGLQNELISDQHLNEQK